MEAALTNGMCPIVSSVLDRWFTPRFRTAHDDILKRTEQILLATDRAGYAANCAAIRDADLRAQLRQITAQTLIIYSDHDPVTTAEDAEFLRAAIPHAKAIGLNAAHLSNSEAAQHFNQALLTFFSAERTHG